MTVIASLREKYHRHVCHQALYWKSGNKPSIADVSSHLSVELSRGLIQRIGKPLGKSALTEQTAETNFESLTKAFLESAFQVLAHLRSGNWQFSVQGNIAQFAQYAHLAEVVDLVRSHKQLLTALGDYVMKPDIVVGRIPVPDKKINEQQAVVESDQLPFLTPFRAENNDTSLPILHASISCKLTLRKNVSENMRAWGLNLIRNRKGHTPHIAMVTAEPMPTRISSLALGTGDIDCVYHFALTELLETAAAMQNEAVNDLLTIMVEGGRLRDIADLPFDLAA